MEDCRRSLHKYNCKKAAICFVNRCFFRNFAPIYYIIRYMEATKNRFLSIEYQLYSLEDGKKELQEQTGEDRPFEFISGFGLALDALERNLLGLGKGVNFDFTLQPEEAFGAYEPEGVHKVDREMFTVNGKFDEENIYEGAVITLMDNEDHRFMAQVKKIEADGVTLDTNHPFAGKVLNFVGTVRENREATEEEVQHLIKHLTGGCEGCGKHKEGCGKQQEGCQGGCCG